MLSSRRNSKYTPRSSDFQNRAQSVPTFKERVPTSKKDKPAHHGLVAHLMDGSSVLEKNNYYSDTLQKRLATNWAEIPKDLIAALELLWKGTSILKLRAQDIPDGGIDSWCFSHTGAIDLANGNNTPIIVSRNIGYEKDGIVTMYRVNEETGTLSFDSRRKT